MVNSKRRPTEGTAENPVDDDELLRVVAALLEHAAERAGSRPAPREGHGDSREAAEWRVRLFEQVSLIAS